MPLGFLRTFSTSPIIDRLIEGTVNTLKGGVFPIEGSIVYCDLFQGFAEHSGVYIGNGEIVHLNGNGIIEAVKIDKFISFWGNSSYIYVSCHGKFSVGGSHIAERARRKISKTRDYNVILNNCHQFSAGCLSGDFENSNNFLWMLKNEAEVQIEANEWRHWDL